MADEIIIETTSAEVIEVGVPGPQGPKGADGAGLSTLTTAGDLLYRNNTEATRLPVGSNGQVLKVSGGLPTWANESGAVTSVNGATGAVTVAAATHATEHEAGEADEIQAMAALVTTEDASLNGIYVPNASGTTSGGRLTLYKPGTRENTKLEYNQSLSVWHLIKNTVIQLVGQEVSATYAWTPQQWLDERSPQSLPNGGTVTRAGLEVLARRAADGTSNVATATTSQDGLLSSADKTKLNGIAANATANTASSATPAALGTASAGSATDYARADHTHSAEVSDSAFRVLGSADATKKVAIEVDTNVPQGQTVTLTAPNASGTIQLTGHAASHASTGSDPLFDQDLNTTDDVTFNSFSIASTAININALGFDSGDVLYGNTKAEGFGNTIDFEQSTISGFGLGTAATADIGTGAWDVAAGDHTHAASAITSGTLTHERGGLEADVSAYNGLVKISGGSTSAVTVSATGESVIGAADAAAARSAISAAAASHTHELTALAATGATNGHVLTANGSNGATFAALPASGVTGAAASASDVLGVSGANITGVDANADRIIFFDDSAGKLTHLTVGSGLSISDTTISATASGGSKTYAVFTAEHNQPPSTAFATLDTRNSIAVLDFDAATDENAVFVGIMPEAASLGSGLIVRLHWMATSATSGNVRWGVQFERSNTDLDADSFDTAVEATAATNGTSGIITTTAITVTTIDGITAGDVFRLKVFRNADDATNDTMTGDAELVAVEVRSAA